MKRWIFAIAAGATLVVVACSNTDSSTAVCPDETTVGSGAACTTAQQKCSGSVDVGGCAGQSANIAEYECTCTNGAWACPQPAPPTCPADAGADVDAEATDGPTTDAPEASTGDDAASDAASDVSTGDDAGDAAADDAGDAGDAAGD